MAVIWDYLNDVQINPPEGSRSFKIKLDFDKDAKDFQGVSSLGDLSFISNEAKFIYQWFLDGKATGVGVTEGIPYRREIHRGGSNPPEVIFNGYLDLMDAPYFSCDLIKLKTKERKRTDWLSDVNHAVTLEYLYKVKKSFGPEFEWLPYVKNPVNNNIEILIASLTIAYTANQIDTVTDKIIELTIEAQNPFEATAIARVVVFIAYVIVLLIALIKLLSDLMALLVQPVKYHACMSVRRQFEIFANYYGFEFASPGFLDDPIFKERLFILPQKYYVAKNIEDTRLFGFTSPNPIDQDGYFKGTFGQLIQAFKEVFNLKIIIPDNKTMMLVKQNYNPSTAMYTLPDIQNRSFTIDANNFKSTRFFEFAIDQSDRNTIQEYYGTSVELITTQSRTNNKDLQLMKGLDERQSIFALAKRKKELTVPEEILKVFLEIFDSITNAIIDAINLLIDIVNAIIDLLNDIIDDLSVIGIDINFQLPTINNIAPVALAIEIDNRIGMLKLEYDAFTVPKLFLMDKSASDANGGAKFNKISSDNETIINADYIRKNFHNVNNFKDNQYLIKTFTGIPFVFADFLLIKNNKYIFDSAGKQCEVINGEWQADTQIASLTIKIPEIYTTNLIEEKTIPDGR